MQPRWIGVLAINEFEQALYERSCALQNIVIPDSTIRLSEVLSDTKRRSVHLLSGETETCLGQPDLVWITEGGKSTTALKHGIRNQPVSEIKYLMAGAFNVDRGGLLRIDIEKDPTSAEVLRRFIFGNARAGLCFVALSIPKAVAAQHQSVVQQYFRSQAALLLGVPEDANLKMLTGNDNWFSACCSQTTVATLADNVALLGDVVGNCSAMQSLGANLIFGPDLAAAEKLIGRLCAPRVTGQRKHVRTTAMSEYASEVMATRREWIEYLMSGRAPGADEMAVAISAVNG
jgi:hypothetical protein